jgi:hypothetical protein
MKAILINPFAKAVSEVDFNGHYTHICDLIDCSLFTVVRLARREVLFVDDEGLLHDKPQAFFSWHGYPHPLAGRGLVIGEEGDGESAPTEFTVQEVRAKVTFPAVELG